MKLISTLLLTCITFGAMSQYSLGISAGASLPRLQYQNEFDRSTTFISVPRMTSSVSIQRLINSKGDLRSKRMLLRAGVDMSLKSYQLDQQNTNIATTFKMNFFGVGFNGQIQTNNNQWMNPYAGLGLGVDFLTSAVQTRGTEQNDLAQHLKKQNYRIDLEGGIMLDILDFGYSTIGVGYARGISNIETGPDESATLSAWRIMAGIHIVINTGEKKYFNPFY